MKNLLTILIVIITTGSISGCYYDKAELLYPSASCDTSSVTYSAKIQNIIQTNCYSCHADSAIGSFGINLDSYANLKLYAENGELMNRITTTDPSIMMPKGGPKLADCDINKIRAWINNGTPN